MKLQILKLLILTLLLSNCNTKAKTEAQSLYNEDFRWSITIPENFENVSVKDWRKMQNKGEKLLEDTYGEEVENEAKTIFVFKQEDHNYFEANYQPYDIEIDGDYLESWHAVNELVYGAFEYQMPGVKIDSMSTVSNIDGLEFQTFKMKIDYPNGVTMHAHLFSRLFDDKEFSVNIMYVDEDLGEQMISSWNASKFNRKKY